MSNNSELIKAIKDAENAITKAISELKAIASASHYIIEPHSIKLECSCDYCMGRRNRQ